LSVSDECLTIWLNIYLLEIRLQAKFIKAKSVATRAAAIIGQAEIASGAPNASDAKFLMMPASGKMSMLPAL
jgi:hypothetical protein